MKIENSEKYYLDLINKLIAAVLSFCTVMSLSAIFKLPANIFLVMILILAFNFLTDLAVKNRRNMIRAGIILLSALGVSFIISLIAGGPAKFFSVIPNSVKWLGSYNAGFENFNLLYSNMIIIAMIIVISAIMCAGVKMINMHLPAAAASAVAVCASFIILGKIDMTVFLAFTAALITAWFYNFYSSMARGKGKDNKFAPLKTYVIWIAALSALIFISAYLMPYSSMPVQIRWLDKKINDIIAARERTTFVKFSFSEIFTQNKDNLGAPIVRNDLLVMTVISPRYVYLKGNISDVYTGNKWLNSDNRAVNYLTAVSNDMREDAFEFEKGIIFLTNGEQPPTGLFIKDSISIKYNRMKTQTIFYSLKPTAFQIDKSVYDKLLLSPNGTLLTGKSVTTGFSYDFTTYSVNYSSDDVAGLLRKSARSIYNSQIILPENSSFLTDDLNVLKKRSDDIYAKYLQLPKDYSKKVIDLAYAVTAQAANQYDKAKAIEEYLSNGFIYSEKPKLPDPGRDFVEQFLFEIKSGYCVHYASSMVVMLRAIGIPARYVEGYMLPDKSEPDKITYKVTNKRSHAWVEAYFAGFGWVMFEPTAGLTDSFYFNSSQSFKNFTSNKTPTPRPSVTPIVIPPSFDPDDLVPTPPNTDLVHFFQSPVFQKTVLAVVGSILFILLLIGSLYLINSHRVKKLMNRISLSGNHESVMIIADQVFKVLAALDLEILPNETAFEYLDRLLKFKELTKANIKNCIGIFVMARYSNRKLAVADKNAMLKSYTAIVSYYIMSSGKFRFFIRRFILGRI